jgi:replicative DNA helicase
MNDPFPPIDQLAPLLDALTVDSTDAVDLKVPTGFQEVDETLHGGLRVGQVTLIGGIAGVGTSTFALGLARNAAFREGLKTLFIAPDSSEREILFRVIAAETRIPLSHLRRGHLHNSELDKLKRHREALTTAPLLVNAGWPVEGTVDTLFDSAQVWRSHGVRFLVLDGTSGAEGHTRELVKRLKTLAIKHRTTVVVVAKAVVPEHRQSARPVLEDLREYEEIADLIDLAIMLHRDDMHDWDSTRPGEADLEIIKHRYGPQRRTTIAFQGHYARFVEMAP